VVVVDETVSGHRYCDTVVIWHPSGAPTNAAGPPLVNELIIIGPDPNDPRRLMEFTAPTDARTIQLNDASLNTTSGRTLIGSIKAASTTIKTLLTPLVRTASTGNGSTSSLRAAVRFECELHPTTAEMTSYRGGSLAWEDVAWPQGWFSTSCGMRQIWLRSELQLVSEEYNERHSSGHGNRPAVPRLGDQLLQPHPVTPRSNLNFSRLDASHRIEFASPRRRRAARGVGRRARAGNDCHDAGGFLCVAPCSGGNAPQFVNIELRSEARQPRGPAFRRPCAA
jgi:hypothetical protein